MTLPNGSLLAVAAARLSHEIRNSLAGIAGALDVLQDRLPGGSDASSVLDRVRREISRIEDSVTELARFAEAPTPVLQRKDLHQVIEAAIGHAALMATTRVQRAYGDGVPPVHLDHRLFADVLVRLFENAQEAMPGGGTITIATSAVFDRILVSIRDTGPGIRKGEQDVIFEPFRSSKTRGLGLGLSIARTVVEAHGGSLSASSVPGGGAELTISLPVR